MANTGEQYLQEWRERQDLAERMIPLVGRMYRDNGVVIRLFGRRLMNHSTIDIHIHPKRDNKILYLYPARH